MQAYGNLFQGRQTVDVHRGPARLQGRLRSAPQSRHHLLRHQPQRRIRLWRRHRVRHRSHPVEERHAQHPSGRSAARYALGFLSGSPFVYTVAIAPPYFSNGEHIGPAAINRNNFSFFLQDTWKMTSRLTLDYGVRWDLYTPITERAHRTSTVPHRQRRAAVCHQSAARLPDRLECVAAPRAGLLAGHNQTSGARRRRHHDHSAQYLAGQLPHRFHAVRGLSAPASPPRTRPFIMDSTSRPRSFRRLHARWRQYFPFRKPQTGPAKHRDGREPL